MRGLTSLKKFNTSGARMLGFSYMYHVILTFLNKNRIPGVITKSFSFLTRHNNDGVKSVTYYRPASQE